MYKIINKNKTPLNAYHCFWDTKGVFNNRTYKVFETEQKAKDYLAYIKKQNIDFFNRYPEQKDSLNYPKQQKYWDDVTEKSKIVKA